MELPQACSTSSDKIKDKFKDKQNIYMLFYAYAQSINRLRKEGASRVLDYWFAWTGVEFFKLLISVSFFSQKKRGRIFFLIFSCAVGFF